jgi:hypothetical protein
MEKEPPCQPFWGLKKRGEKGKKGARYEERGRGEKRTLKRRK